MNDLKLYNLSQLMTEALEIENEVERHQKFNELELKVAEKIDNIVKFNQNLDSSIVAIDAEVIRLEELKDSFQKKQDWLKMYLKNTMEAAGLLKFNTDLFKIRIQRNPPSVEILNEAAIPDAYKKTKTEITIDKNKLKSDLTAGIEVAGVRLINDKTRLVIE